MNWFDNFSFQEVMDKTELYEDDLIEDFKEKEEEDYLNRNGERNEEVTHQLDYNCGGYALGTFNWYKPYEGHTENRYDKIMEWFYEFFDTLDKGTNSLLEKAQMALDEAEEKLLWRDVCYMLKHFSGRLRVIDPNKETVWDNERLIAYRIGVKGYWGYDDNNKQEFVLNNVDVDFHYRYTDDGEVWKEKLGGGELRFCEDPTISTDSWDEPGWTYTSNIVYLALQM